ncbi:MAG: SprT family zinc-dependent metalloprotease [Pseudomonadota bacterium]
MAFQFSFFNHKSRDEHKAWIHSLDLQVKRRAYQKTITIRVDRQGVVRIGCSKTCPQKEIDAFLVKNRDWVEQCLRQVVEHQEKFPKKRFSAGEEFLFLGQRLHLRHVSSHRKRPRMHIEGSELVLDLGVRPYCPSLVDHYTGAMQSFYKASGVTLLERLVEECAEKMGLYPEKVGFRSQKSRWGSCSSEGNISLNWRLVCAPVRVANYVVVHELAHLKHQDHSANFWSLVEKHCPEFKACKNWLNHNQFEFDFLHG